MMTVLWPAGSRVPDGRALPWVSYPSFKVGFRHVICSGSGDLRRKLVLFAVQSFAVELGRGPWKNFQFWTVVSLRKSLDLTSSPINFGHIAMKAESFDCGAFSVVLWGCYANLRPFCKFGITCCPDLLLDKTLDS